jgi:dTDP-glucose 4,6-dehydratase
MICQALGGQPLPVYGDGRNVRDWIHVLDHCRAIDLILRSGREGEVYNIGGGCELENIAVARRILKLLGQPEDLLKFVNDRPAHDRRYALDCRKMREELGWEPTRDFERGLADTIAWYKNNKSWLEETRSGEYQNYFKRHYVRREQTFAASAKMRT